MRATACIKCRQVKARCDAAARIPLGCSRCRSLGVDCVYDPAFKRTSKAKLIQKMASEIQELRDALESSTSTAAAATGTPDLERQRSPPAESTTAAAPSPAPVPSVPDAIVLDAETSHLPSAIWTGRPVRALPDLLTSSPDSPPTTSPGQSSVAYVAAYRSIGPVSLTASQVAEIFKRYFSRYHPHLPFKMTDSSADAIFASSPLLFWVICAITSPRLQATLSPAIKRLVEETVHTPLHGVETVQALVLLCVWPFRVSFLSDDFSYFYSSMASQIGLQLGLHRPTGTHCYRYSWDVQPMLDRDVRLTTWMACFAVDRMQAAMRGVPYSLLAHPELVRALDDPDLDPGLTHLCRILHIFSEATLEIGFNGPLPSGLREPETRLTLLRLWTERLTALDARKQSLDDARRIVFLYARVQLRAFVLQDDVPISAEVLEMIKLLEEDTCDLVDLCNTMNLAIAPGHVRVAMTYVGFVLVRILQTPYSTQREVLEEKLERIIQALTASASSQDDVANKACLILQGLPYMTDLKRTPPILTRMAAWVSYDSRRIFWENWAKMHPDQDPPGHCQPSPAAASRPVHSTI